MQSPSEALIPPKERQALEALFVSTNGSLWFEKGGWLGPIGSECAAPGWFGIQCNADATNVIGIELSGNGLSGGIPPEIQDLTHLVDLRLSANMLSGPIPEAVGSLTNLQNLHLDGNYLVGEIPTNIPALTSLRKLHLNRNRLAGPIPTAWGSASIESIDLSTNLLSGTVPESLAMLSNLRELRLAGNTFRGGVPTTFLERSACRIIDLRWNAIAVTNLELRRFLDARSPDADMLSTQTLPPASISQSPFAQPRFLGVQWSAASYTASEGGYQFLVKTSSGSTYSKDRIPQKSFTGFNIIGIVPGDYQVTVETFTSPHAANPNEVLSTPSAPVQITVVERPLTPGKVGFVFAGYVEAAEGERVLVPVQRFGGVDGEVSVRARALEGSADLGDFIPSSEILRWSSGESQLQGVAVSILADDEVESPESVEVILDQPQGGVELGFLSRTSVSILDSDVSGSGTDPVAARDPSGTILFVWIAPEGNGTTAVFGRFADPRGRPTGESFQISDSSPDLDEYNPRAVSVKDDHFEVAWQNKKGAVRRCVIRVRGGIDLGKQLLVSSSVDTDSLNIAGDSKSNRFALTWTSSGHVLGRMYSRDEQIIRTLRVDGPTPGRSMRPSLAFHSGTHISLFTWEQEMHSGDLDVWGRFVSARGFNLGSEFRLNGEVSGSQALPRITETKSGFFVVWRSTPLEPSNDPAGTELRGLAIRMPERKLSVEFRVNRELTGSQNGLTVTTDRFGNCVIGWLRDGAEINGLFSRSLQGCRDAGPVEAPVRIFRNRRVRVPTAFQAGASTGFVFEIEDNVNNNGGIGVETLDINGQR